MIKTRTERDYGDGTAVISSFLVISIVIDSYRGHCYEHLIKKKFTMKIERVTCI